MCKSNTKLLQDFSSCHLNSLTSYNEASELQPIALVERADFNPPIRRGSKKRGKKKKSVQMR